MTKLFREHCTLFNGSFVKDMERMGRRMEDIIIVDNSPIAFMFQPENALPILSWYEDTNDRELPRFANLLEKLSRVEDVRKVITKICVDNQVDP